MANDANNKVEDLSAVFGAINNVLSKSNLEGVTADSDDYQELPEGYYLVELTSAKLTVSKSSGQPMAALKLKVTEGYEMYTDNKGNVNLRESKKASNKKTNKFYVLKDEDGMIRFKKDMLKFEGSEEGKPLLEDEFFTSAELINEALGVIEGSRIWLQVTYSGEGTEQQVWSNFITWKRAKALGLPM